MICITAYNRFPRSIVICFVFLIEVRVVTRKTCLGRSSLRANNRFPRSIVRLMLLQGLGLVGLIENFLLVAQLLNPNLSSSNVSRKSLKEAEVTHIPSRI